MCQFFIKQTNFGPILAPIGPKILKQDFSQKNHFDRLGDFIFAVTSCEKSEKFYALIFHETSKPHFWSILGPFCPKIPEQDFF